MVGLAAIGLIGVLNYFGPRKSGTAALAVGLVALLTLPREEEPQISVPMVDIMVQANGLKAEDAVKLVTEPLETIVKSIDGVEHVYSQTRDDKVMVTARFLVGTSSDGTAFSAAARSGSPRISGSTARAPPAGTAAAWAASRMRLPINRISA